MKLVQKTRQDRRDFDGIFECEGCGNSVTQTGYDDHCFHAEVTPRMKCPECGESTKSLGCAVVPVATRYSADEVV